MALVAACLALLRASARTTTERRDGAEDLRWNAAEEVLLRARLHACGAIVVMYVFVLWNVLIRVSGKAVCAYCSRQQRLEV